MESLAHTNGSWPHEALVLARYLTASAPSETLAARYYESEQATARGLESELDRRIVDLAVRHPRALGALDSACAVLRPKAVLRDKLLRMAAVLEASPEGAADFLPRCHGPLATTFRLAAIGAIAMVQFAAGAVLLAGLKLGAAARSDPR